MIAFILLVVASPEATLSGVARHLSGNWQCATKALSPSDELQPVASTMAFAPTTTGFTIDFKREAPFELHVEATVAYDDKARRFVKRTRSGNDTNEQTASVFDGKRIVWDGVYSKWREHTAVPYRQIYVLESTDAFELTVDVQPPSGWRTQMTSQCKRSKRL